MKAIVYTEYGPPSKALALEEVEKPTPKDDEVLVQIHATSVNAGDLFLVRGEPFVARLSSGLQKPKYKVVPVVDRCFPLSEAAKALRHHGEGHPQGKVVITVAHDARGGD